MAFTMYREKGSDRQRKKNPFAKAKKQIMKDVKENSVTDYNQGSYKGKMKSGSYPLYKGGKHSESKTRRVAMVSGKPKKKGKKGY